MGMTLSDKLSILNIEFAFIGFKQIYWAIQMKQSRTKRLFNDMQYFWGKTNLFGGFSQENLYLQWLQKMWTFVCP